MIMSTVSTITINEIPQSMFSENGFPAGPEPEMDEKERIRRALEINNGPVSYTHLGRVTMWRGSLK